MAAIDDLARALSQGRCPGDLLTTISVTGTAGDDFKRQVNQRHVNPTIPAGVATALGVSATDAQYGLTRGGGHGTTKAQK